MDWFKQITGFKELDYATTQSRLRIEDGRLCSTHSDRRPAVGRLETPSLGELRQRVANLAKSRTPGRVSCLVGDARKLHANPQHRGALFQVASQFNLLEMTGPSVTPEHGVTGYISDGTQGPACAIAAGAATIFRNYLVEVDGVPGQRRHRQIDCLADLGAALGNESGRLWQMENGYAMCSAKGLAEIDRQLAECDPAQLDDLRGRLRIGLHFAVEVTDRQAAPGQLVSQAFCSALPVAYSGHRGAPWRRFATLVLEACYEATILAAALNAAADGSNGLLLTRVGGGAFGNDNAWINGAIDRPLGLALELGLDVRIVCFGSVPGDVRELVGRYL